MNRGLMLKAAYEIWPATLLCAALLFGIEALLAYALPTFEAQLSETVMQIGFMKNFIGAMLGMNINDSLGPEVIQGYSWAHPVVLAVVWTHALMCCTRTPAGEIDRGTADVSFTLNVTRWEIMISETVVWLVAGAIMLAIALAGNKFGALFATVDRQPPLDRTLLVMANLYCLYLAVGGLAWLASSLADRRGPAITASFVVLLASFLLNFLAQFWSVAERLSWLGLMAYFRPLFIYRDGSVPWGDMAVLLSLAVVLWTTAGVIFSRRDVCTT